MAKQAKWEVVVVVRKTEHASKNALGVFTRKKLAADLARYVQQVDPHVVAEPCVQRQHRWHTALAVRGVLRLRHGTAQRSPDGTTRKPRDVPKATAHG